MPLIEKVRCVVPHLKKYQIQSQSWSTTKIQLEKPSWIISKCISGYILESEDCGVKPDSHGRSMFPCSSGRKFKYEFCLVTWRKAFFHAPGKACVVWKCCEVAKLLLILFSLEYDGLFLSNGPGDPTMCSATIDNLRRLLELKEDIPVFGICMGHQIMALAAGCKAFKMK